MVSSDVSAGKDSLQKVGSMVRPVLLEHMHTLDERDIRQMVDRAKKWNGNGVPWRIDQGDGPITATDAVGGSCPWTLSSSFQMASEVGSRHTCCCWTMRIHVPLVELRVQAGTDGTVFFEA